MSIEQKEISRRDFFRLSGAILGLAAITGCLPREWITPTSAETPTPIATPSPTKPPELTPTPTETPTETPTIPPEKTPEVEPTATPAVEFPAEFLPVGASVEPLPFREIEGFRVLRTPENTSVAKFFNEEGEHLAYLGSYPPLMYTESMEMLSPQVKEGLIFYGEKVVYLPWFPKKEGLTPYPALNKENKLVVVYVDEGGRVDSIEEKYVQLLGEGQTAKMNFEEGWAEVNGVILPIWGEPAPEPTPTPTPEIKGHEIIGQTERGYEERVRTEVLGVPVEVTLVTSKSLQERGSNPIQKIMLYTERFPDAPQRLAEGVMRGHWHAWVSKDPGGREGISFEQFMARVKAGEDMSYTILGFPEGVPATQENLQEIIINPSKPVEFTFIANKGFAKYSTGMNFNFRTKQAQELSMEVYNGGYDHKYNLRRNSLWKIGAIGTGLFYLSYPEGQEGEGWGRGSPSFLDIRDLFVPYREGKEWVGILILGL